MNRSKVHLLLILVALFFVAAAWNNSHPLALAQGNAPSEQEVNSSGLSSSTRLVHFMPQNLIVTSVADGFDVTWNTSQPTKGLILYGQTLNELTIRARDSQPYGTAHHISVRGLNAYEVYYFVISTTAGYYGTNGGPFKLVTESGSPISVPEAAVEEIPRQLPPVMPTGKADIIEVETEADSELISPSVSIGEPFAPLPPLADDALLSDGQFVYGPNAYDFDSAGYIDQNLPLLKPYAGKIEEIAAVYSINPRVLLTLIELRWPTFGDSTQSKSASIEDLTVETFVAEFDLIIQPMFAAFYQHLSDVSSRPLEARHIDPLLLADGTEITMAPATNAGSYAVLQAAATIALSSAEFSTMASPVTAGGFRETYRRLFPDNDPLSQANKILIPDSPADVPPAGLFQLPYPAGEAWRFNAAHAPNNSVTTLASIDFWPVSNSLTSGWTRVVAATDGTFTRWPLTSTCQVEVRQSSGWQASYYHLEGIPSNFANNRVISKGTQIGRLADTYNEATCHKGSWTNPHVHFTLKYNGRFVNVNGAPLARWLVRGAGASCTGSNRFYFEKGSLKRYCGDWVLNHPDNDNNQIVNNQTYSGSINPANDTDRFSFSGQKGQKVQVWMNRSDSGSLDSYLRLYNSNDVLIGYNDDFSTLNSYITLTLPEAGTYQIIASSYNGKSDGAYTLKLQITNSGPNYTPPSGYTFCAYENQRCSFSDRRDVAYGANGVFTYRYGVTGGIDCNNGVFGDPLSGIVKACFTKSAPATCTPDANQVALFIDGDYRGQCVVKGIGAYTNPSAIGMPNDSISSVMVGSNVRLLLFEHDGYQGRSSTFSGNDSNLSNNTIGNDSASSMKVETRSGGSSGNLALNRSAYATSYESSAFSASRGNDGNNSTRWSSAHSSNQTQTQWWIVDLGSSKAFNQIKINWEAAYATSYFVGWSDATNCSGTYNGFNYSRGGSGWATLNIGNRTARCIGVMMRVKLAGMANYSFWELEAYNLTTRSATPPGVLTIDGTVVDMLPPPDFAETGLVAVDGP